MDIPVYSSIFPKRSQKMEISDPSPGFFRSDPHIFVEA